MISEMVNLKCVKWILLSVVVVAAGAWMGGYAQGYANRQDDYYSQHRKEIASLTEHYEAQLDACVYVLKGYKEKRVK